MFWAEIQANAIKRGRPISVGDAWIAALRLLMKCLGYTTIPATSKTFRVSVDKQSLRQTGQQITLIVAINPP